MPTQERKGKGKNPVGRPHWKPNQEELDMAEKLAGQGMTQSQIADAMGIHQSTLMDKKHEYPEFAEAIKRGKAKGIAHVTNKLMAKISGMDTASILFYLKCQANWREIPESEQSNAGNKIEINITGGPPNGE